MVANWLSWNPSPQELPHSQLDRKLEIWKVSFVKTTLDLPADLVREMKLRAAHEGRKLRDVATEIFRRGLMQSGPAAGVAAHRVKLPLIDCPTASGDLTAERVSELLAQQEVEWTHETAGR